MPAPPKHRDAIVDAAVALFRRQGFSGTGLADIVAKSGAPKGSLYHYFPHGKDSIAEEAVREAGRRVAETVRKLYDQTSTTGELLVAHAKLLAGWMEHSGFRDGCPITTVLLEMAPGHPAVTTAGRDSYAARTKVMTERLIADGLAPKRAERLAILCVATLQGALIQARVDKSSAAILAAAEELAGLLPRVAAKRKAKVAAR